MKEYLIKKIGADMSNAHIEKIKEETLTELYSKKTSPKTLKIQKAKTAQCQAVLLWDSSNGTYIKEC